MDNREFGPIAIMELIMCCEELAELQKEISKFARSKGNLNNTIEEIADVLISIDVLRDMLGIHQEQIEAMKEAKLKRNAIRKSKGEAYV